MKTRTLGRTNLDVSVVGMGTWAIGGGYIIEGNPIGYGQTDDFESIAAIEKALDSGVNVFDTADAYGMGHSEVLLGQVLQSRRSDAMVATKVGNYRRDPFPLIKNFEKDYMFTACTSSLRRLRRSCIEIYQLHDPEISILRDDEIWKVMDEFKDRGWVKHIGVSVWTPEEAMELIHKDRVDVLQIPYSLLNSKWDVEVLPAARENSVGILAREPLENGLLTGKYDSESVFPADDHRSRKYGPEPLKAILSRIHPLREIASSAGLSLIELSLKFVLSHPAVSCVIPGAKRPEQVVENCSVGENPTLDESVMKDIREVIRDEN